MQFKLLNIGGLFLPQEPKLLGIDICFVLFCSVAQSCLTLATSWTAACQASLSFTNSWSLLKLMPIELVMPSSHLILCCSLLLLPSVFPNIKVFSKESVLQIRWPKTGVLGSASVFPMNIQDWYPLGVTGLISLSPSYSQESPPTPQFKSISSSVLSFLYGPSLTSTHD